MAGSHFITDIFEKKSRIDDKMNHYNFKKFVLAYLTACRAPRPFQNE